MVYLPSVVLNVKYHKNKLTLSIVKLCENDDKNKKLCTKGMKTNKNKRKTCITMHFFLVLFFAFFK